MSGRQVWPGPTSSPGLGCVKTRRTINLDRRNYSSKTALVAQLASEFNLEVELKNIIPVVFRFFEFLHSQGQKRKSWPCGRMFAVGTRVTSRPPHRSVRAQFGHTAPTSGV